MFAARESKLRDALGDLRTKLDKAGELTIRRFAKLTAQGDDAHSRAERSLSDLERSIGGAQ
ncbi:hypothetical protein J4558_09445 [Leptolyngbya sp. 15MV]|nr:hypothetical protein J4558_09445 [Leptolyngbya sp. 15MV]